MKFADAFSVFCLLAAGTQAVADCAVSTPDLALELPDSIEVHWVEFDEETKNLNLMLSGALCDIRFLGDDILPVDSPQDALKRTADIQAAKRQLNLRLDWPNVDTEVKRSSEELPEEVLLEMTEIVAPHAQTVLGYYLLDDNKLAFGACLPDPNAEDGRANALKVLRSVRKTSTLEECPQ